MNEYQHLQFDIDPRGVARIRLNRPEVHNAFNEALIAELSTLFEKLEQDGSVRLAVLSGNGKSFCAGGDLNWMRGVKDFSEKENRDDARRLSTMFERLRRASMPLVGLAHGAALGGGSGLLAVCDYVIAAENAVFGFTEARLGIVPGIISPYVIGKIGAGNARAYFLSGMKFPAVVAQRIGLVHHICRPEELEEQGEQAIAEFLKAGPQASRSAKLLVAQVAGLLYAGKREEMLDYCVRSIAEARVSEEGQEGMDALLSGRSPAWVQK